MTRILTIIFLSLVQVVWVSAAPLAPEMDGLRIRAFVPDTPIASPHWAPDTLKPDQRRILRIYVLLTNVGRIDLKLPTSKWEISTASSFAERDSPGYSVTMRFDEPSVFDIQSVPSEVAYAPVILKSKETTILVLRQEIPVGLPIEKIVLEYNVDLAA